MRYLGTCEESFETFSTNIHSRLGSDFASIFAITRTAYTRRISIDRLLVFGVEKKIKMRLPNWPGCLS